MNLKFRFDYGTDFCCIWSGDSEAFDKFGCVVEHEWLNISKELDLKIQELCQEYQSSLNWNYPPDHSPWTEAQKQNFIQKTECVYNKLISEIGELYQIDYDVILPD